MGTKIPFRFPMVDQLVPTVQFYDVSKLVSAPIEPRGLVGFDIPSISVPAPNPFTLTLTIHSRGPGGILVDFLALDSSFAGAWTFLITDLNLAPLLASTPKQDVGGTPTVSTVRAAEEIHLAGLSGGASPMPPAVNIQASPRFFVRSGLFVVIQGPQGTVGGERMTATVSWAELPASFEQP